MVERILFVLTMVIVWGCMTFRYVGNGFSYALWASAIALGVLFWKYKKIPRFQLHPLLAKALLVLYGVLLVVGALQHDNLGNLVGPAYSAVDLLMITLPLWLILMIGWTFDVRRPACIVIFVNMWAFSVYGLWQYYATSQDRLASFYGSPPEVGMLLDLLIPCTVALGAYYWKQIWCRWVVVPLVPLEFVALFLSETRGSYLALSAALVVTGAMWLFFEKDQISIKKKIVFCGCVAAFIYASASYTMMIGSESQNRMKGGERLLMWESSYHMWEDHKILGIGLSEWEAQYNDPDGPYRPVEGQETTNVMPHNIFIYFLSAGGLISLIAFLGYLFFMMKYLIDMIRRHMNNPFAWMMLFIFIAFISHGLVDGTIISRHIGRIFYLLMGLGILFTERWQHDSK